MRLVLTRLAVRHWAATVGTSPTRLVGAIGVATGLLAVVARGAVHRWALTPDTPEVALMGLALALFSATAAYAIFASHAGALAPSLGFLRGLPTSPRQRRRAGSVPVLMLGGLAAVGLGGPLVTVVDRHAGYGTVHALFGVLLVGAGGAAVGRVAWSASHRALTGPGLAALRLTGAYLAWLVLVAISLAWPTRALGLVGWPAGVALAAPLVWPLPWWVLVEPTDVAVAAAVTVVALAWVVAQRTSPRAASEARRSRADVRTARLHPHAPVLVAAVITAVRLRRHPRSLEALVVSSFLALATVVGAVWLGRTGPARLSPTAVAILGSQVVAAFAVLVRGLSSRTAPAEAALGLAPWHHVVGGWAAVTSLAGLASLPALVPLAVLVAPSAVAVWLAGLVLHTAIAVAVSTALTPPVGHGGAEASALLAYALVDTAAIRILGPLSAGLGAIALLAAIAIERHHRSAR